ncbi:hypothetical protein K1719_020704 [Acacia pycnantha]|nr:hypothetical protein K1719_020704 [Acacia pycnantha]
MSSDTKFDVGPLFSLVDNTLTRSTHIIDGVVQGNSQLSLEHVDDQNTEANFSSPLCTLRQISSEVIPKSCTLLYYTARTKILE